VYAFLISSMHAASPVQHPPWFHHGIDILWKVQIWSFTLRIFSSLLPFPVSYIQIFSSAPCSKTPSICVLPLVSQIKFHAHTKQEVKL
jgi:hypothetical protein